jgi:riboflavin biosynthesis pyrimidine reductase
MKELYGLGVRSVMVEGGAALITALLCERLVDRLAVCVAPKILGRGIEAVGDLGIRDLTDSLTLSDTKVAAYGTDTVFDSRVVYPNGAR